MKETYYNKLKNQIKVQFDAKIKLNKKKNMRVLISLTQASKEYKEVKIMQINSNKNELIIKINLQETFEGQEVNLNHVNIYILPKSMVLNFKKKKDLPASKAIEKKSSSDVYFSKYPIITEDISIYIPSKKSSGEATVQAAADIGSKVV